MKNSRLIKDNLDGLYTLGPDMEEPATNVDNIQKMKQMLKVAMEISLTTKQRQAVNLFYFDGLKATDIAKVMNISNQAVYRLLKDSRKKLEKLKNII